MTVDDLLAVKAVSDPQVSPDGTLVVYVVSELDRDDGQDEQRPLARPGRRRRAEATDDRAREPTTIPAGAPTARRSPSSRPAAARRRSGSCRSTAARPGQLTKLPIDVSGPIWSPKGDKIAFTAEVYPGKTPEETAAKDKEKEASKSKVRIYDRLMIRHWDKPGTKGSGATCSSPTPGPARRRT